MEIRNVKLPKLSPFGLIQESLFPSEWLILVSCILLNRTSRKQVEKIFRDFIKKWPNASAFMNAPIEDVALLCKPLGFSNVRTKNLFAMTQRYLTGPWDNASQLPGIGDYGTRAWEIFCNDNLGNTEPTDGALAIYWRWRTLQEKQK